VPLSVANGKARCSSIINMINPTTCVGRKEHLMQHYTTTPIRFAEEIITKTASLIISNNAELLQEIIEKSLLASFNSNFKTSEEQFLKNMHGFMQNVFANLCNNVDDMLFDNVNKHELKSNGKKEKSFITSFGRISINRRRYKSISNNKTHYLFDEATKFPKRDRITPFLRDLVVSNASTLSFHKTSNLFLPYTNVYFQLQL
jgi:hypothetical protein